MNMPDSPHRLPLGNPVGSTFKITSWYDTSDHLRIQHWDDEMMVAHHGLSHHHLPSGLLQKLPNKFLECYPCLLRLHPYRAGVLNLWGVMTDDLRWRWCNNRNKVHNECNAREASWNHPTPHPTLVSRKIVFHETGPWRQKGWGPLL